MVLRTAVIDLGTNTFNLLIAEQKEDGFTTIFQKKYPVKLGQSGIHKNLITEDAYRRGLQQILKIKDDIAYYGADRIKAFATSAIRGAINGKAFVREIHSKTGIKVKVISGSKEAEFIYLGVKAGLKLYSTPSMIMDIGGGSTEFIICNNEGILWKKSFKLGAARLLELFKPEDPMTEKECAVINHYFKKKLKSLAKALSENPVKELIGSSGSFDTFADILFFRWHNTPFPSQQIEFSFPEQDLGLVLDAMIRMRKEERLKTPGMLAMRAEMIGIAALFSKFILHEFNISTCRLSTYSLKEGVLQTITKEK